MKEVRWSQFITEELRFAESESLKNDARQTAREISLTFDIKDLTHEHESVPVFFACYHHGKQEIHKICCCKK